jgi:hypothetical protein
MVINAGGIGGSLPYFDRKKAMSSKSVESIYQSTSFLINLMECFLLKEIKDKNAVSKRPAEPRSPVKMKSPRISELS